MSNLKRYFVLNKLYKVLNRIKFIYLKLIKLKYLRALGKGVNHLFHNLVLTYSFNEATSCFLQIFRTQNNFWDIAGLSQILQ